MKQNVLLLYSLCLLALVTACTNDKNKKIPDVSGIAIEYDWIRFDHLFFEMDSTRLIEQIETLEARHPAFFDLYLSRIMGDPGRKTQASDVEKQEVVRSMQRARSLKALADSVNVYFGEMEDIRVEFDNAFRFYQHYFPSRKAPHVYTFLSEFGYASLIFSDETGHDCIGLGLDMFLGPGFPYDLMPIYSGSFSSYLTKSFRKEYLVKKGIDGLADDIVPVPQGQKMIDWLLYEGKKMWLIDKLLPLTPDSIKWEWSKVQYNWVEQNEWNIWSFLIEQDLLYSNRLSDHQKYLRSTPHSAGMPPEAPGRAAVYIGYRMVHKLMEQEKSLDFERLLQIDDGQSFLERAKYKPLR